jgi:hypothetical protein
MVTCANGAEPCTSHRGGPHYSGPISTSQIAGLVRHGLLRPPFIPDRPQREQRALTRTSLIRDHTAVVNRRIPWTQVCRCTRVNVMKDREVAYKSPTVSARVGLKVRP